MHDKKLFPECKRSSTLSVLFGLVPAHPQQSVFEIKRDLSFEGGPL